MKTISPGHEYELDDGTPLRFRSKGNPAGVTTEDLIQVLAARLRVQRQLVPNMENFMAEKAVLQAVHWLEKREAKRVALGVLGTQEVHTFPLPEVAD